MGLDACPPQAIRPPPPQREKKKMMLLQQHLPADHMYGSFLKVKIKITVHKYRQNERPTNRTDS